MVTLGQARAAFPSLGESAACAQKLKAAIFDGIREADMTAVMENLVSKAKDGNLAATKVLLDFVSKSAPTPQLSVGARLNVAGQGPVNGHAGDDDEVRESVAGELDGDKLGKTADGLIRRLRGRHDAAAVAGAIDAMLADGELVAELGAYRLAEQP